MPISPGSFELRDSLPSSWFGLRDDELSAVSGVEGCVFCHATGFVAGNHTRQGVIDMAVKALEL